MYQRGLSAFHFFSRSRINHNHYYQCGESVYKTTGAIAGAPHITRFGFLKVILTIAPFLFGGAYISKQGAKFLEDNEIFVPEED
ncbi:unnamed protein product [Rodentolepis nana]|uniref:Essential MCU regulator, mitochondrial n=1 Tax=Rodentolepis nana TaxID=102285 RepID=A0A0R3T4X3_RODNA|nr:unnamed protein product [Rodentolepis nana]